MTLLEKIETPDCCAAPNDRPPITIDQALLCIARTTGAVARTEQVALASARGRVLAAAVRCRDMVPPFNNAAMDGYAVATADLSGDGPWHLQVVDQVAAGQAGPPRLAQGTAIRIFTGAPVPPGADGVVMQEQVARHGDQITLKRRIAPGTHIRRAGEDMMRGQIVVPSGRCLRPGDIAACAAAGHASVPVYRPLRVALLVTGDEVCQPDHGRGVAGIWDVNTPMLCAAMDRPDLDRYAVERAADTRAALRVQLDALADRVDLIVTTGGLSVGGADHVKPALRDLGCRIGFSGVAMKPGKPVSFGRLRQALWLGLPGNPLAAFVTWQIFGLPLVQALGGMAEGAQRRPVVLSRGLMHKPGRCELRLARLIGRNADGVEIAECGDATHSGRVGDLTSADGVLVIPAAADKLARGARLDFQPF